MTSHRTDATTFPGTDPTAFPMPLGQVLLERGLVTEEALEKALESQSADNRGRLIGEILVEQGAVEEASVMEVVAEAYGIPFVRGAARLADPAIVECLPREFVEEHSVLPLFKVRGTLTVAVAEPANLYLVEEIRRVSGCDVQLAVATRDDIESSLESYLPTASVFVIDNIYEDVADTDFSVIERETAEIADLKEVAGHSPVVKLVNYMIYSAVQEGASDIHVEPDDHALRIRYRIDGRLFEKLSPPHQMAPAIASRIKIMAGLDISERRVPQDGDIHVRMEARPIDLRVSTMPGRWGEKVVIRVIDARNSIVELDRLGMASETLERWREIVDLPNGVILVTGPTGSGKSTTLYSVLATLDRSVRNVSTVEDPVESTLTGVNQFPINDKAGFGFAQALRSLLRQDPDVIMVGEIRDGETAALTTQAALTGHLVFSTLHTNEACGAITRLLNLQIEPYLVAATLRGVLAQRLVRKTCANCRTTYRPDDALRRLLGTSQISSDELWHGAGCSRCRETGFAGRIGIFELLIPDDTFLEAVARGESLGKLRSIAVESGLVPLRDDGFAKAIEGLTTIEEVLNAVRS
ncbi:MAG: Flp pilus assembly complex ATPase component TadA [Phycisphaerales bacterium]|nr:Flp pilus assembly complex ATPase component TadA [Phycisphaerales bacterium]